MSVWAQDALVTRLGKRMARRILAGCLGAGLMGCVALGQQYDRTRDDPQNTKTDSRKYSAASELAKSNLSRVAASAGQIREVLVKDIGLMVELKRWIAKDAADNGQVVEDSSLTDEAIFERLERDVEFRSYATM